MAKHILTPEGTSAGHMDRVMLLAKWARHINTLREGASKAALISAGMGKPTANQPSKPDIGGAANDQPSDAPIDYGNPQGELEYRVKIAKIFSGFYKVAIKAEHIIFTVGGAGALHIAFKLFNNCGKTTRTVTTAPYYTLYPGKDGYNNLHLIDVMELPGYRLTVDALQKGIDEAIELGKEDGVMPGSVLLCDPCNPTGTAYTEEEAKAFAALLAEDKYKDLTIILDGAYEEMAYNSDRLSLLTACAKHDKKHGTTLLSRVIQMRSGTKGLSAAGERWAVCIAPGQEIMTQLLATNIGISGHAPKSSQAAYAEAMQLLTQTHQTYLKKHYQPQTTHIFKSLEAMGARMPDPAYKIDATFYVMANLHDMIGYKPSPETVQYLQNKVGLDVPKGMLSTDEEIAFWLMKEHGIMLQPLSYNGVDASKGYVRITCSNGEESNTELMRRLEDALTVARKQKQGQLLPDSTLAAIDLTASVKKEADKNRTAWIATVDSYVSRSSRFHGKMIMMPEDEREGTFVIRPVAASVSSHSFLNNAEATHHKSHAPHVLISAGSATLLGLLIASQVTSVSALAVALIAITGSGALGAGVGCAVARNSGASSDGGVSLPIAGAGHAAAEFSL